MRHAGQVTTEVAREALELLEVDEVGLERIDRELLGAIVDKFGGGPVGLSTLAVSLGEEPDTIEEVYEPFLLQLGFIQRTPRGRVITDLGRGHVGVARGRREPLLMPELWTPGMAGPLDQLVERIHTPRRGVQGEPRREPKSVSRSSSTTARCIGWRRSPPEPGFGFITLCPHPDERGRGADRAAGRDRADPHRHLRARAAARVLVPVRIGTTIQRMSIWSWFTKIRNARDAAAMRRREAQEDETPEERTYTSGDIGGIQADEFVHELTRDTPSEGERLGE